jgi:hypothetical protein
MNIFQQQRSFRDPVWTFPDVGLNRTVTVVAAEIIDASGNRPFLPGDFTEPVESPEVLFVDQLPDRRTSVAAELR